MRPLRSPSLGVDLDAVPEHFKDKDPVFFVDVYRDRPSEPPFRFQVHAAAGLPNVGVGLQVGVHPGRGDLRVANQSGDENTVGPIHLHPVSDQSVTYTSPSESTATPEGRFKPPTPNAVPSNVLRNCPPAENFWTPPVPPIGHVNVPVAVEADAPGQFQLTVTAAPLAPIWTETGHLWRISVSGSSGCPPPAGCHRRRTLFPKGRSTLRRRCPVFPTWIERRPLCRTR